MLTVALLIAAAVLAVVAIVQARAQTILGWAVVLLCAALLLGHGL